MKRLAFALTLCALAVPAAFSKDPARAPKSEKEEIRHIDPYLAGGNEGRIAEEVRHQLVLLPDFGVFDDLGFIVHGSEVTLVGEVTRPSLRSEAAAVVKRVEGVTLVNNNIDVLPLSPNDDRIRLAAYRAIYGDPALSTRYGFRAVPSIHIIVRNGNIRLEGVVANMMDRNLIGIRANGVHGAFSVENGLRVEGR